jgi:trans-2,3-dihydro-3-hydroxyanthranilate isomerase
MSISFYIVDVFAEERFAGNQLAVFRGNPSPDIMQKLAVEMNYSEITFITSDQPNNGGYDVRIFMPTKEVPFAGHPTLGTAYIVQRELIGQAVQQVVLNLGVGQIPVTFCDDGVLWMQQKPPQFGHVYTAVQAADVLRLSEADIDSRFPVQEVTTGLPFIITPLKSLAAVKRARIDTDKLRAMISSVQGLGAEAMLIFCTETEHSANHLHVRVPDDAAGCVKTPLPEAPTAV